MTASFPGCRSGALKISVLLYVPEVWRERSGGLETYSTTDPFTQRHTHKNRDLNSRQC